MGNAFALSAPTGQLQAPAQAAAVDMALDKAGINPAQATSEEVAKVAMVTVGEEVAMEVAKSHTSAFPVLTGAELTEQPDVFQIVTEDLVAFLQMELEGDANTTIQIGVRDQIAIAENEVVVEGDQKTLWVYLSPEFWGFIKATIDRAPKVTTTTTTTTTTATTGLEGADLEKMKDAVARILRFEINQVQIKSDNPDLFDKDTAITKEEKGVVEQQIVLLEKSSFVKFVQEFRRHSRIDGFIEVLQTFSDFHANPSLQASIAKFVGLLNAVKDKKTFKAMLSLKGDALTLIATLEGKDVLRNVNVLLNDSIVALRVAA